MNPYLYKIWVSILDDMQLWALHPASHHDMRMDRHSVSGETAGQTEKTPAGSHSHLASFWVQRFPCVCVVYCNVVCLNMIWFLVLLNPFQTNTSLVLFMLFWILKDIPCISQWSHKKTCYFLTLEALWHPPKFFVGGAQNSRYPMIIFLPFFLSQRWPEEHNGASLTVDFFIASPWRKRFNDLCGMDEMAGGVLTSWYWKRETKITCAKEGIGFML